MYQLTIARSGEQPTTTGHADAGGAYRALLAHAVGADLYLHGRRPGLCGAAARFELVELAEKQRDSRIVGTATISPGAGS